MRGAVMPIIPMDEGEEPIASNVRLARKTWEAIDEVQRYASSKSKRNYSRNEVMTFLLEWAANKFWEDEGGKPKPKK